MHHLHKGDYLQILVRLPRVVRHVVSSCHITGEQKHKAPQLSMDRYTTYSKLSHSRPQDARMLSLIIESPVTINTKTEILSLLMQHALND